LLLNVAIISVNAPVVSARVHFGHPALFAMRASLR
jgi:hypothetical protein